MQCRVESQRACENSSADVEHKSIVEPTELYERSFYAYKKHGAKLCPRLRQSGYTREDKTENLRDVSPLSDLI